jgi:hypothetical protein
MHAFISKIFFGTFNNLMPHYWNCSKIKSKHWRNRGKVDTTNTHIHDRSIIKEENEEPKSVPQEHKNGIIIVL